MKRSHWRWFIGLSCLLLLAAREANRSYPLVTGPLALTLTLPAGSAGQTSPLVTTGQAGTGAVLYVRYTGPATIAFGYDSWAAGGPESAPIAFTPGVPHPLVIDLPALAAPPGVERSARGLLRVIYQEQEVLRGSVHYRGREANQVYFASNPIGGTITNHDFPGALATTAGLVLQGRPSALFPWPARLRHWLTSRPLAVAWAGLISLGAALLLPALAGGVVTLWRRRMNPVHAGSTRPPHLTFALTTLVCAAAFVTVVTGGTFRLFEAESFGQFYDYQIASLLEGRLDVPEPALSSESFVYQGKYYGYFGPTPALLRLPFALTGIGFARLSRSYLLLYYLASLGAAYALLIHAARRLSRKSTWPGRTQVVLLVGGAGLGSTLFFVASRAYIYHEAILCGAAFALWGTWGCLRWLAEPARHRGWLLALACGVLAVHARPPVGLFALGCLGFAAAALLLRAWSAPAPADADLAAPRPARRLLPLGVGLLAVLGVLSFNGLSYLKFGTFGGSPLRYNLQYNPARLAHLAGSNFHAANVPFGFATYVWLPSLTLRPTFPYIYSRGSNPADFPDHRIDLAENTLGLPYAMPSLCFLAALGGLVALSHWSAAREPLAVLVAGVAPMTAALFAAIAVSQRYTADFVPFLVSAAAFGVTGLAVLPPRLRRAFTAVAIIFTLAAVLITGALTLHYQSEDVWGVPDDVKANYLSLRQTMDQLLGFTRP